MKTKLICTHSTKSRQSMVSTRGPVVLRRFLAVSLATAVCLTVVGCGGDETAAQLRVEDFEFKLLPGGARIVSGTVHNDGDQPIRAAQVQISLFDRDNRRVDAMFAVVRDLPAKGSFSFREPVQSELDDISGARVRSVLLLDN